MYTFLKALFSAATTSLLFVTPLWGNDIDSKDAVKTVIRNVDRNYSHIKSARGELQYIRSDSPEVRKRLVQRLRDQNTRFAAGQTKTGADGYSLTISPLEQQYGPFTHPFVILGPDVRVNGFTTQVQIVSIVKGDKLAIYDPTNKTIQIRDRHTETKMFRDPRNVFYDESQRLTELLADQENVTAKFNDSDQGKLLNVQFETKGDYRVSMNLDAARSYLPVFVAEVRPHINTTTEVTYQELKLNGESAWFPAKLTFKTWRKSVPVTEKTESGWNQKFVYTIKNLKLTSDITPSEFTLEIPEGTWVDNAVDDSYYHANSNLRLP